MDKQEWSKEQQVWQRIRSAQEEGQKNDLRQLQREAMELAAIYRGLMPRMKGHQQEQLARLHQGERNNAAVLAGIGILSHQNPEHLKLWQPEKEEPKKLLERCYHRTRRCLTEYLARSAEGEFGVLFERMAKREAEHCMIIAEVLGNL